jgi:hypothetical protein
MGVKDLGYGTDKYLPDGDVEGNRPTMLHYLMGYYYYYLNYLLDQRQRAQFAE